MKVLEVKNSLNYFSDENLKTWLREPGLSDRNDQLTV